VVAQAYWLAAVAEHCLGSPDDPLGDLADGPPGDSGAAQDSE